MSNLGTTLSDWLVAASGKPRLTCVKYTRKKSGHSSLYLNNIIDDYLFLCYREQTRVEMETVL